MVVRPTHVLRRVLLCPLGFHLRSRKRATSDGFHWRSSCVYCDRPLTKSSDGKWRADRSEAPAESRAD